MDANEFQQLIRKFRNPELTWEQSVCNATMGLAGEIGELCTWFKQESITRDQKPTILLEFGDKILDEFSDVTHYFAWLLDLIQMDFQLVMDESYQNSNWVKAPNGRSALFFVAQSGELIDIFKKKIFHGVEPTFEKMEWSVLATNKYLWGMARHYQLHPEQVFEHNIVKLDARYPNGFVKGGGIR